MIINYPLKPIYLRVLKNRILSLLNIFLITLVGQMEKNLKNITCEEYAKVYLRISAFKGQEF